MNKYTPQIVEAVMQKLLDEVGRLYWNQHQAAWGEPYTSLEWGPFSIEVFDLDGDRRMTVTVLGETFSCWLDKRPFYHAELPNGWDDQRFIGWATEVFKLI